MLLSLVYIMSGPKYNFGSPSKMKGLQAGEKATFKFLDLPNKIDTEWGVKYTVSILLLSHPEYPSLSSSGMQMQWQTGSTVMVKTIVPLLEEDTAQAKEFHKDYKTLTWELVCMDDGSLWLTNA
tara:strand:- start:557 stop:928 length:372 start_codon:yes stop_codon:yes gene_type:complete